MKNLDFQSVLKTKKQIKESLKEKNDYVEGEENLLVCRSLDIKLKDLLLKNEFSKSEQKKIEKVFQKRLKGWPLDKILKSCNFFGLDFFIDKSVLAPRKETEILVEKVLEYAKDLPCPKILDLCCGSGVIGLCLSKFSKNDAQVTLSDIDKKALKVCKKNKEKILANAKIVESDLFNDLNKENKFDIIVSNPPYIPTKDIKSLDDSVKLFDPKIALDGGEEGLEFYKEISKRAKDFLESGGALFLEIGFDQGQAVKKLFEKDFKTQIFKDYSKHDRIVFCKAKF